MIAAANQPKAKRLDRAAIAARLVKAAIAYCEEFGTPFICRGDLNKGRPIQARIGNAEIMYLSKAIRLTNWPPHYLLDIYIDGIGKVFSAWAYPIDIVKLKPGDWINELLGAIEQKPGREAGTETWA